MVRAADAMESEMLAIAFAESQRALKSAVRVGSPQIVRSARVAPSCTECTRQPTRRSRSGSRNEPRRSKVPSCWGRSKSAIRVIWVWTRRVRVCRCRIGRTGNSTADDSTRRDAGGDAAPTSPVITASVATTADVDVAVDVDVAAVHVGTVEVAAVHVGAVEVAAVHIGAAEVAAVRIGAAEVAAVRVSAAEVAAAGTGPGTAATAAETAAATAASTAAAASAPLWHTRTSGTPVPSGTVAMILRPMLPLQATGAAEASVATNPTKAIGAM
jgi:hypothetical protein